MRKEILLYEQDLVLAIERWKPSEEALEGRRDVAERVEAIEQTLSDEKVLLEEIAIAMEKANGHTIGALRRAVILLFI